METRLRLQTRLEELLGVGHVYFQPPETVKMAFPAVRYRLIDYHPTYADNRPYTLTDTYELIFITADPDDPRRKQIALLPGCRMTSSYTADNLNHYVYQLHMTYLIREEKTHA